MHCCMPQPLHSWCLSVLPLNGWQILFLPLLSSPLLSSPLLSSPLLSSPLLSSPLTSLTARFPSLPHLELIASQEIVHTFKRKQWVKGHTCECSLQNPTSTANRLQWIVTNQVALGYLELHLENRRPATYQTHWAPPANVLPNLMAVDTAVFIAGLWMMKSCSKIK